MIPERRSMSKQEDILKKWKILQGMIRFYFCIDDPSLPYKGVHGKRSVKVHSDVNFNVLIAQKTHLRYLGNLEHPMAQELIDAIGKPRTSNGTGTYRCN